MDIRPHVHAKLGLTDFCAIYQYAPMEPSSIGYESHLGLFPSRDEGFRHPIWGPLTLSPKEGVFTPATPSLVWLQPLDECLMFRSKVTNHVASVASPLSESPFLGSREFKLARQFIAEGEETSVRPRKLETGSRM